MAAIKSSVQIAVALVLANFILLTAPGMIIMGLAGIALELFLPHHFSKGIDFDFNASGLCGILWPAGIPPAVWALQHLRQRWTVGQYVLTLLGVLYVWAMVVVATILHFLG